MEKMIPGEDPKHALGLWEAGGGSGRLWEAWGRKKLIKNVEQTVVFVIFEENVLTLCF